MNNTALAAQALDNALIQTIEADRSLIPGATASELDGQLQLAIEETDDAPRFLAAAIATLAALPALPVPFQAVFPAARTIAGLSSDMTLDQAVAIVSQATAQTVEIK